MRFSDKSINFRTLLQKYCFMAESRIFRNLLSAMKHVGILALAVTCHGLERSFRILLASGIQGPPSAAILPL